MMHERAPEDCAEPTAGLASDPADWLAQHGDALYRFARSRIGRREVAEDLVQETLLAALKAQDGFRGSSSPRTWLLAILRRKIADHYRQAPDAASGPGSEAGRGPSKGRSSSIFFDADDHWLEPPARWKTPLEALEDEEFWAVFHDCLAHLPEHLARAFRFREIEGIEIDRLRTILDIGASNVRVRLHRARLLLRACLEKNWFDVEPEPERSPRPS